ncbi:hypothetical protein [Kluyvera intermedia]|uniref:Uncharacterized protein n=1 Tax=Kluyvera intermedia TaxID=61648 RepID=A0AA95JVP2_KLUIN|nr:hypothetical protein [Kluyvera intermedia]WGL57677.1 hypothetical protein QBD33_07860 [Kluyvera intermedia]
MWRESTLAFTGNMASVNCSIIPAHPWVYGLGQLNDSGGYLSPANALGYLAGKLATSGGKGDVIVIMIAENTHDIFMTALKELATVFPAPAFTQVSRMAAAAAELSAVKMQLPVKVDVLPVAVPLSVSTSRLAANAQRIAAAQLEAATGTNPAELQSQVAGFIKERAAQLAALSGAMDGLKQASARIWAFSYSGNHTAAALELLKDIPQITAVHTAAMMFVGDSLSDLQGMIHDPDRLTRA